MRVLAWRSLWLCSALLILPLSSSLSAQEAPEAFGESIDVRVVNVEAVVTGRHGERVRGLTAADFRLLVDGKEVPEATSGPSPRAETRPLARWCCR